MVKLPAAVTLLLHHVKTGNDRAIVVVAVEFAAYQIGDDPNLSG